MLTVSHVDLLTSCISPTPPASLMCRYHQVLPRLLFECGPLQERGGWGIHFEITPTSQTIIVSFDVLKHQQYCFGLSFFRIFVIFIIVTIVNLIGSTIISSGSFVFFVGSRSQSAC